MLRRFRRRLSGLWLSAAVLAAVVMARLAYDLLATSGLDSHHSGPRERPLSEGPCEFVRVADSETIVVRQPSSAENGTVSREVLIRLLGVARPRNEISPHDRQLAASANAFAQQFLASGPPRLQLDKRQIDHDQQFLAYVFVGDRMLNEELVRAGFVRVANSSGDSQSIARRLRAAEDEARRRGRGLWANNPRDDFSDSPSPEAPVRDED